MSGNPTTLGHVILYVADVARSVAFYEAAFGLSRAFVHESGTWGAMATGETVLAFCAETEVANMGLPFRRLRGDLAEAPGIEIAFTTDDVPAALARAVAAGAVLARGVEQMPWGQTVAYVRDENGVLIELCSPMDH